MTRPEPRYLFRRDLLPAVVVATYAVALVAWAVLLAHDTVEGALLGDHDAGMHVSQPGAMEALALADGAVGVCHYLAMWSVMMVAMMYPASAGVFQWYADVRPRLPVGAGGVATFAAVYTLVWALVGVVPLAVNAVVPIAPLAARWGTLYLGVALFVAGVFQLSPLKRRYLRRCRYPAALLADEKFEGTTTAALGWRFGREDLGACGVLMALMVAVGSMNLRWMALITAVLVLERQTPRGERWARAAGLAAAVAGVALVGVWLR